MSPIDNSLQKRSNVFDPLEQNIEQLQLFIKCPPSNYGCVCSNFLAPHNYKLIRIKKKLLKFFSTLASIFLNKYHFTDVTEEQKWIAKMVQFTSASVTHFHKRAIVRDTLVKTF